MAFKLNVSFQGGGSFLAAMLPIAHAISDARKNNHIELEGVAGSSAGSVAAALLAADADFSALREYCLKGLRADAAKAAGPFFSPLGKRAVFKALCKIALGADLLRPTELEKFFRTIFKHAKINLTKDDGNGPTPLDLSHFSGAAGPRLIVTRSGMELAKLEMPTEGELISLLVDSCSIPFVLRNFKSARKHPFVDGGLCENLPISGFDLEGESSILAVSVDDANEHDNNYSLFSFAQGLFSTAINNNVEKSKEIVGELMTIEEIVPFSFHQVSAAVDWIEDDTAYAKIYDKTTRKLLDLASFHTQHHGEGKFVTSRNTKASRDINLKNLLHGLHDSNSFEVTGVELRVNAESLLNPDHNSYQRLDIVTSSAVVRVNDPSKNFYKSYIPLLDGRFHPVTWRVSNVTRSHRGVDFSPFHFHDESDGGDRYDPCFIRFNNPSGDFEVGDELKIECIYAVPAGMTDLASKGRDFLSVCNSHASPLPLEMVIIYPNFLGKVSFESREKAGSETYDFKAFSEAEIKGRLGRDALTLAAAGVRSVGPVKAGDWLSVWISRGQ